ncbi:MAG: topoisomerase DNA-binding C4 zinc finger domain-containing protein [Gammaproteobacteria bacterium]
MLICPKCGAKLVERTVMKGINVGEKYWGCANLPACRYTRKKSRVAN